MADNYGNEEEEINTDDDDYDWTDYDTFPEVSVKPLNIYTWIMFFVTIMIGFFRTLTEASANLGEAIMGAEYHREEQKDFQDTVRLDLERIDTHSTEE